LQINGVYKKKKKKILWGVRVRFSASRQMILNLISHGVPQYLQANTDMPPLKGVLHTVSDSFTDVRCVQKGSFSKQRRNEETERTVHKVFEIEFPER
jgi:hypothetical protein